MKENPVKQEHYGVEVWVNPLTEGMRDEECLCLNCDSLKMGEDNCPIAKKLYKICVEDNMALTITICKEFEEKEGKSC